MRVLIADDSVTSRRLLESFLKKWGYEVIAVESGTEAAKILCGDDPPRLAILDWVMPGMDGATVCQAVRANVTEPYIYLLLLTSKNTKDDIVEGLRAGADDYLTKPFYAGELELRTTAARRVLNLQSELMKAREIVEERATRDPLTGLPNRLLFADRLIQGISHAQRYEEKLAVMFLDLDSFKYINDSLGHTIGDLLLKQVAERLTTSVRTVDTIARMGGDEFTIVQTKVNDQNDAITVAKRVLDAFKEPFYLDEAEVFVSTSIGISIYPDDGTDAETIVRNADMAMYHSKSHGKNTFRMYNRSMDDTSCWRATIQNTLRRSLERDEFVLYYQPRLSIADGSIVGAEALLRWQHPELGMVMPDKFISIAEDTGMITPIGEWVLKTACVQNKAWQDAGLPPIEMAVNVSIKQTKSNNFKESIENALSESGMKANYLGLELTESAFIAEPEKTIALLNSIRNMGAKLYIDDFGTGYSSLSYLKKLPIDGLKIDRSFINDLVTSLDDSAIVRSIVAMAHNLNLCVTAEGVETLDQLAFLKIIGCDEVQGYFASRPVPAEQFEELLASRKPIIDTNWDKAA